MKTIISTVLSVCLALVLSGCNGGGTTNVKTTPRAPSGEMWKAAVVSLGVNDWAGSLTVGGNRNSAPFIDSEMTRIIQGTEAELGKYFSVKPIAQFINDPAYRALSLGKAKTGLFTPVVGGTEIPSFTEDRGQIIKCVLAPEIAKALCSQLGVDRVVVIYSEWAVATGKFIPTSKALTKNCVAIYDADGKRLFFDRKDLNGKKTLGAIGRVAINEETISQWSDAYLQGFEMVIRKNL